MLLDLPRSKPLDFMVPLHLDDPTKLGDEQEADLLLWAGNAQTYREIAPEIRRIIKPEKTAKDGTTTGKVVDMAGWDLLCKALREVHAETGSDLFRRAADAVVVNHEKIVAAAEKLGEDLTPKRRLLLLFEGKVLQDDEAYKKYRDIEKDKRDKKAVGWTNPVDSQNTKKVFRTTPASADGHGKGKLGSNISVSDRSQESWGQPQNSRMRLTDDEFIEHNRSLEDGTVPSKKVRLGSDQQPTWIYCALWDVGDVAAKRDYGGKIKPSILRHRNMESNKRLQEQLDLLLDGSSSDNDTSEKAFLKAQAKYLEKRGLKTPEDAPDDARYRFAMFRLEGRVRYWMTDYRAVSPREMLLGLQRWSHFYGGLGPKQVLRALDRPRPEAKDDSIVPRQYRDLVVRMLAGKPASRQDAARAAVQYIKDIKVDTSYRDRPRAQLAIMEDYMSENPEIIDSPYYRLGRTVWEGASIAYDSVTERKGKSATDEAKRRQNMFLMKYLPIAKTQPVRAINMMSRKLNAYTRTCRFASGKYLNWEQQASEVVDLPTVPTDQRHILVAKGFADAKQDHFDRVNQLAAAKAAKEEEEEESTGSETTTVE